MMVVMTAMTMAGLGCLRQILYVRQLAALGGAGEIGGKLIQGIRCRGLAFGLGGRRGFLEIGGDLLGNLLILGRVGLLQLLQRAH